MISTSAHNSPTPSPAGSTALLSSLRVIPLRSRLLPLQESPPVVPNSRDLATPTGPNQTAEPLERDESANEGEPGWSTAEDERLLATCDALLTGTMGQDAWEAIAKNFPTRCDAPFLIFCVHAQCKSVRVDIHRSRTLRLWFVRATTDRCV